MKDTDIGHMLKQLESKLHTRANATFSKSELTYSQVRVLKIIWKHGGQVTQKEIEKELKVSHPPIVGIVRRLEKSGYVNCHVDPDDRRNKLVCGTERALKHRKWHDARIRETEKQLTEGFSSQELQTLREMLKRLYKNIE